MEPPPLTLEITALTPYTLVPELPDASSHNGGPPSIPADLLSPTSNYPGPHGTALLGETLAVSVSLRNTSAELVRGAKMMLEMQSPTGRFRLGEAIHGAAAREDGSDPSSADARAWDEMPALQPGEVLSLQGKHDIAELKTHILIASVAWETVDGRRTFQRFVKFGVNAPIDIKTRVYTPTHPSATLSPHRSDIYLEVLMFNISPVTISFESVEIDPVPGLQARAVGRNEAAAAGVVTEGEAAGSSPASPALGSLQSGDTVQRLFVLTPTDEDVPTPAMEGPTRRLLEGLPVSSFPPTFATSTLLPLGRLDIAWVSGPYRERGRFQTSTLKWRTPIVPLLSTVPPTPGSRPGTPSRISFQAASARNSVVAPKWEFDLLLDAPHSVEIENEFEVNFKVAVRSAPVLADDTAPPPPRPLQLGLQLLYRPPAPPTALIAPSLTVRPPSRINTPSMSGRPASPTVNPSRSPSLSRPMTPVSQQLRHAAVSNLASPISTPGSAFTPPPPTPAVPPTAAFPPPPLGGQATRRGVAPPPPGRAVSLGASLVLPPPVEWRLMREKPGTSYAAEAPGTVVYRRWEAAYTVPVKFLALAGGLAELGGARVLVMDESSVGREWESIGDVWVVDE